MMRRRMHRFLARFGRDERGFAAEFALVLPLLIIFILGTIDVGMYIWRINQAEKATQAGARFAAVTNPLVTELTTTSYVNQTIGGVLVEQGDRVPSDALGVITCTKDTCVCDNTDGGCPITSKTTEAIPFANLLQRMQFIFPAIRDTNLQVEYRGSGLGFAGDPNGPDLAPIITVRLTGMSYTPIVLSPFGTAVSLPDFAYSITAEDANGTASN